MGSKLETVFCSRSSIFFFNFVPPIAEKPPREPEEEIIRWQGIISGRLLLAMTEPAALAALGEPANLAKLP